ncbi:hypothetical protein B0I37DRAFT_190634 [Chaetomium sp. MPI-CAGE-AT-0009]|nr:hypothetical protein B0I37DRAFT_190634 [Chaetomium sp. MPI-CAGE-AT-0009]
MPPSKYAATAAPTGSSARGPTGAATSSSTRGPTGAPPSATTSTQKSTTTGSGNTATGTSKAAEALKAAVAPKATAGSTPAGPTRTGTLPKTTPTRTATIPKSTGASRRSSSVEVEFLVNRVLFSEYQKGDLIEVIEAAAEKLGMTGKVVAAALSHEADPGNGDTGRSTWKIELRKPLVASCEQLYVLRIRTSYDVPSMWGKK